jgi:signal transduction histidine kinase
MEAMDGTIAVSSNLGEGCTFWLELPMDVSDL